MTEKRYITNKYICCYCAKNEDILVGMRPYRFVNTFILPLSIASLCALVAILDISLFIRIVSVVCILLFFTLLSKSYYSHAKKEMLQRKHTEECSHKVAHMAVLYAGIWSEFRIMKDKEN